MGLPMHMVLLPHIPLVVVWREPVGMGIVLVEVLVGRAVVLVVVVEVEGG